MALTNRMNNIVNLPNWQQLNFNPNTTVSSALSATCYPDNGNFHPEYNRLMNYLLGSGSYWQYDTWTDSYQQLSSPPIAPATYSSLKFSGAYGFEGRVLAATSNTITIPHYSGKSLKGFEVRIFSGTGKGQQRMVTDVGNVIVGDTGVVTAATATSITDTAKAWAINQWVGYQIRIAYGTGISQVRRVLYNDATSITFVDVNRYAVDNQCNPMAPSPALSATAGAQSIYTIESAIATVETAWDITPDETSRFRFLSGAEVMLSGAAGAPFYTLQVRDKISDTWYIRTACSNLFTAVGTDGTVERTTENASVWELGIATGSHTTTTLQDTTKNWTVNSLAGKYMFIYSGTSSGSIRLIASNTANTLTWASALGSAPTATSRYKIVGFDAGTASSGSTTTLVDSTKTWATDRWKNYIVRVLSGTGIGQTASISSNTATTLTFYRPLGTALDSTSVYSIEGDKDNVYIFQGGQAALALHSIESDIATFGRSTDDGLTRIGSAQYGEFPAVPVTSIAGATATKTVTTAIPHGFKTGWTVSHKGDTGASAVQNNISAVITVTGATTYTYTATGSTAAATYGTLSTTVLIDATKNWTVNEHANKVCYFTTAAPAVGTGAATMVAMEIASNTANSLTFKTATTAPVNGVSRYSVCSRPAIGALDSGIATGTQSTTTLQDTSKTWVVNIWAGRKLKMISGTGQAIEIAIVSNTSNTLTFGITTAPVAASTSYSILGATTKGPGINSCWNYGTTDTAKAGRNIIIPRGGGVQGFDSLDIPTDTWTLLSTSPQIETLSTGTMTSYDGADRLYFTKDATMRFYYIDLVSNRIFGAGIAPVIAAGAATIGNRMEILETKDGIKYLWVNRHSNADNFRTLIHW